MTTPTSFGSLGISIMVTGRIVGHNDGTRASLQEKVSGYEHTISAFGGYDSATITFQDSIPNLEEWYERGIGRHVTVYDEALTVIWEGFVNQVTLEAGARSVVRGPLIEIGNKVRCVYTPMADTARTPALASRYTSTSWATDATSQASYGTVEKVLSSGDKLAAAAEQTRDTWLMDNREPATTYQLASQRGDNPSATLQCAGYKEWLRAYTFIDTTTGTRTVTAKIGDVLNADTNGLFSGANASIADNTVSMSRQDDANRTALTAIQSAVEIGDIYDNRYTFGIYANRKAVYAAVPTTARYLVRMHGYGTEFTTPSGTIVHPWQIVPACWLFDADFLVGRVPSATNIRNDPRYAFVEQVSYSAPYGVQISGGKVDRITQRLARLGLAGRT